jgi:ABC-type branched-subunit amino acid transport system substrate-binding protein
LPERASSPKPILIGVSLGLSNGFASLAKPVAHAVRVAEGQINAAGGVLGRPVVFDVRDDESDETDGVVEKVARDFVARGAVAVIGPLGSQQVLRTQAIFANAGIVQLTPTATSTLLSASQPLSDRWLFRTTPSDDLQAAAVLAFAEKTPRRFVESPGDVGPPAPCTKLALVHIDNAYGTSMATLIERSFLRKTGHSVVSRHAVGLTPIDSYAAIVNKVMPLAPACLALIAYDDVALAFVRDFKFDVRYSALAQKGFFFIGTDGVHTARFLRSGRQDPSDATSANPAEGVFGTTPDTQPETNAYNEFRTLFSSYLPLGESDAPPFASSAYDAAILVALAVARAGGTTDRVWIRESLRAVATPPGRPYTPGQVFDALLGAQQGEDIDYKGASGNVDFEPDGDVKGGFSLWQAYRDGSQQLTYRTIGRLTVEELLGQLK